MDHLARRSRGTLDSQITIRTAMETVKGLIYLFCLEEINDDDDILV